MSVCLTCSSFAIADISLRIIGPSRSRISIDLRQSNILRSRSMYLMYRFCIQYDCILYVPLQRHMCSKDFSPLHLSCHCRSSYVTHASGGMGKQFRMMTANPWISSMKCMLPLMIGPLGDRGRVTLAQK